jgi:hypothetical protein
LHFNTVLALALGWLTAELALRYLTQGVLAEPDLKMEQKTNGAKNKEGGSLKPPSWSIDHFGKGSPIGSNRHDFVRPLFPWFSASSRAVTFFRSADGLLKCKYRAKS